MFKGGVLGNHGFPRPWFSRKLKRRGPGESTEGAPLLGAKGALNLGSPEN